MRKIASKVLIVDDEPQIRKFLNISLEAHHYKVLEADCAKEAIRITTTQKPDVVILDLGLPDKDGREVIKTLREFTKIPIIVLSVRKDEADKIEAIDLGASDYVVKPFGMGELLARIRACLRDRIHAVQGNHVFSCGELRVDLLRHEVSLRGQVIALSPKEYELLKVLVENAGKVITHKQLIQEVWGKAYDGDDTQYLRIYIRQLRRKLEQDRSKDHYIHNIPGIGYRLDFIAPEMI